MRYARLTQHLEVMGHRALGEVAVQRTARDLAPRLQHPDYLEPDRVAKRVEDVGEINILESRVVEVSHSISLFDV